MIPKIVCWLFGHIIRERYFTGKTWDTINQVTGLSTRGEYYVWKYCDICPRCGKVISLNEKQTKKDSNL